MYKIKWNTILLGVLLSATSCQPKKPEVGAKPPVLVTAFQIKPITIPAVFEFVGVAKSSHPVEIRARVEGYLWSVDYVEGSPVKIGDPLFQLDPRPFIASLEEASGMLDREEAILWRAKKSLDRMTVLFPKNAVSQRDLDDATASVMAAEASVISAKANVEQAELNLSFTRIAAPIDGLSGRAIYQQGSLISPSVNGLLTQVSVIDPIWVLFNVSDNELLIGKGEKKRKELILPDQQEYTVQLELSDGSLFPYTGKLNFTSPTLDPATGSLIVRATFQNPEGLILPGQFVRASVMGASRPNALIIPKQSVSQGRDGAYVFVINKGGTVSLRTIQLGEWFENYWIVKDGLKPGEVIVVDGTNKIADGASVKVTTVSLPSTSEFKEESTK
ncbi:MAG: efflux RND transporter periplasmic adaptor subunit [Chlamydiota bacterium]